MSRDTWAYDYQNPVELNRYVYVSNNPTKYVDPSGNVNLITNALHQAKVVWKGSMGLRFGVGGTVGAFLGAVMGELHAISTYNQMARGACGSRTLPDRESFIKEAIVSGAVWGFMVGASTAVGGFPAIMIASMLMYMGANGVADATIEVISDAMNGYGINACAVNDGIDSLLTIVGAAEMMRNAYRPSTAQVRNETEEILTGGDETLPSTGRGGDLLPELNGYDRLSFTNGEYDIVNLEPGERLYRSPNTYYNNPEPTNNPGRFFGTQDATNILEFEAMYNVAQYGNDLGVVRVYEVVEPITVYRGQVYGGTGTQVLIPRTSLSSIQFIFEHNLIPIISQ